MRRLLIPLILLTCTFTGCLSDSTKAKLSDLGQEVGQRVAQGLKDEGVKIAAEAKAAAFEGGKAGTAAIIKADPDIAPEKKDSLLAQLADAAGFAGIGGVLIAYAKAKAAAKAKRALGIVVNASKELPEAALGQLKQEVKNLGGDHPTVASLIAEVKQ